MARGAAPTTLNSSAYLKRIAGEVLPKPGHELVTHGDDVSVATEEGVPPSEVSRLRAELAAKDEAMAAKDHKIAQLEALLQSASAGGNA